MMPLQNVHILAIDDTASILAFLRISLETLGATFHGAATASGGLAMCESEKPDLVILDLGLPDHEGFDILPRLKRMSKDKDLPVVVLTVRKEQESRSKAQMLGADAYVTKPFVVDDLVEVIQDVLGLKRSMPPQGNNGDISQVLH